MTSMSELSSSAPDYYSQFIPDESDGIEKHIAFTKLVLDLIEKRPQTGATSRKKSSKRTRKDQPATEKDKIILRLANISFGRNSSKIAHSETSTDVPMESQDTQEIIKTTKEKLQSQLSALEDKKKTENSKNPETTEIKAPPKQKRKMTSKEDMKSEDTSMELPQQPQETTQHILQPEGKKVEKPLQQSTQVEKPYHQLKISAENLDKSLRSLEPFTIEGLLEKEKKKGSVSDTREKEVLPILVSIELRNVKENIENFCAIYFQVTLLANTLPSPEREKFQNLVTSMDKKFGHYPLVKEYIHALEEYSLSQKAKRSEKPLKSTKPSQPIHEMKEMKQQADANTRALLEGQERVLQAQKDQTDESRKDLARARGLQYFGLYGQIAMAATAGLGNIGATGGGALGGTIGAAAGMAAGTATGATLLGAAGPAVAFTALATQIPTWRSDEWIGGALTFLSLYGATILAECAKCPVPPPSVVASIGTTLGAGPIGKFIHFLKSRDKVISQKHDWKKAAGKSGKTELQTLFGPILNFAKEFSEPSEKASDSEMKAEDPQQIWDGPFF